MVQVSPGFSVFTTTSMYTTAEIHTKIKHPQVFVRVGKDDVVAASIWRNTPVNHADNKGNQMTPSPTPPPPSVTLVYLIPARIGHDSVDVVEDDGRHVRRLLRFEGQLENGVRVLVPNG